MKSSIFLAASSALLAMAAPARLNKRVMETEWEVVVVTQTVTANFGGVFLEDAGPTAAPEPVVEAPKKAKVEAKPEPVVYETVYEPAPTAKPETKPAPKPEVKTETKPVAKPVAKVETKPAPEPESKPKESSSGESSSEKADVSGDYSSTMLKQHNIHRANHSVPALQWDNELAGWAKQLAQGCTFRHDRDMASYEIGQNIASGGSTVGVTGKSVSYGAKAVTNAWYNGEMEDWPSYTAPDGPGDDEALFEKVGHFSQVLWKGTQKVGCASVECDASSGLLGGMPGVFTVCNYSPPGNYAGQYAKNVLPPLGKAMVTV